MRRIALAALLFSALTLPSVANAISIAHAKRIIIHKVGPGTTVDHCRHLSHGRVLCHYSTPAENQWEIEEGWTYESWMTV